MTDTSVFSLIAQASLVSQLILLVLVGLSIFSWSIIFNKYWALHRTQSDIRRFKQIFWDTKNLNELQDRVANNPQRFGILGQIFHAGIREFIKSHQAGSPSPTEAAKRAMNACTSEQLDTLENQLNYLATTGSVSPYIGLLGTVWGVMGAFLGLSSNVQHTLSAVAPGIAEALIATAVGLFAAIPAVIAYNSFANRIDRIAQQIDSFSDEFLNIMQRQVAQDE